MNESLGKAIEVQINHLKKEIRDREAFKRRKECVCSAGDFPPNYHGVECTVRCDD